MIRVVLRMLTVAAGVIRAQQAPDLAAGVLPQLFVHGGHFSVRQCFPLSVMLVK